MHSPRTCACLCVMQDGWVWGENAQAWIVVSRVDHEGNARTVHEGGQREAQALSEVNPGHA